MKILKINLESSDVKRFIEHIYAVPGATVVAIAPSHMMADRNGFTVTDYAIWYSAEREIR